MSVPFFSLYIADIGMKVMGICGPMLPYSYKGIRNGVYFR